MSADSLPDQGVWTREKIEHVWDVFYQAGYAHDRESMYYDEGANSEFCETHRRSLRVALDLAQVVPASERDRLAAKCDQRGADIAALTAENAELRAELGRRDDVLTQIGRTVKAYEASIGEQGDLTYQDWDDLRAAISPQPDPLADVMREAVDDLQNGRVEDAIQRLLNAVDHTPASDENNLTTDGES